MARKKSRRGRARQTPRMYPRGAPTSSSVKIGRQQREVDEAVAPTAPAPTTGQELREEYWYVYNDLRRIAVVAGALFVILIGLSFFL